MADTFQQLQSRTGQTNPRNYPSYNNQNQANNINVTSQSNASYQNIVQDSSTVAPNPYEEKFHSEFCFISLVLGIFGLVLPLFSTLAIIFGIGGLMQTHREHMKGRWMAITGILLGILGILLIVVAIIWGIEFLQNYMLSFGGVETLIGEAHKFAG